MKAKEKSFQVVFLGTYLPRECGIATFTKDLSTAIEKDFSPLIKSKVIAMNDKSHYYRYGPEVISQIDENKKEDYHKAAGMVNKSKKIRIVFVQHEFGIFGGEFGSMLLEFLRSVKKKKALTFHSVLSNPLPERKRLVKDIAANVDLMIVMSKRAREILTSEYGIEPKKISLIYHGVPSVEFAHPKEMKKRLGLQNKTILSTFGLLSRGKGLEVAIKALPRVVKRFPSILYLVIGETHPNVRSQEGESYRNELIALVDELGLQNHVRFYNRFLELKEITDLLQATDVYLSSSLDPNQIVSGTISYAMGAGKAIIASKNNYTGEVLADERGILVDIANEEQITQELLRVLKDGKLKSLLENNSYLFGRQMLWPNVARKHVLEFNKLLSPHKALEVRIPRITLKHLVRMTDSFGLIQFANYSTPDPKSGYATDDNARALIAAVKAKKLLKSAHAKQLIDTYLDFLEFMQKKNGSFHNIADSRKHFLDEKGSEDSFGRSVWGIGEAISLKLGKKQHLKAKKMLFRALELLESLESPRAKSFALVGLSKAVKELKSPAVRKKIRFLADSLLESFNNASWKEWHWFEEYLTYANSKMPEALFCAFEAIPEKAYIKTAKKSIWFLINQVMVGGTFAPIGQREWFHRGKTRSMFDQQPIEASEMTLALLKALEVTRDREYYQHALTAFDWFLGKNHLNQKVYDEKTGGCFDGFNETTLNSNQGAEALVSYLLARLELEKFIKKRKGKR